MYERSVVLKHFWHKYSSADPFAETFVVSSAKPYWVPFPGLSSLAFFLYSVSSSHITRLWWQLFPLGKISILGHCFLLSSSSKVSVFVGHLHLEASWYVKFSMQMKAAFFTPKLISLPDSIWFSTATILSELNTVVFSFFHFSPYLANSFVILLPYISWSHPFYHCSNSIFSFKIMSEFTRKLQKELKEFLLCPSSAIPKC